MSSYFDLDKAIQFNSKYATMPLPEQSFDPFPRLMWDRSRPDFSLEVLEVQKHLGFKDFEQDGMLGQQTYMSLCSKFDQISEKYITYSGRRYKIKAQDYKILCFDQKGGLDLHPSGKFSERWEDPEAVCMHWGGLNAKHCFNVFQSRNASSHFLIDRGIVYQILDLKHRAWHAGWVNDWTIGIDICQSPRTAYKKHYGDLNIIKNPSNRGERKILELHEDIISTTKSFLNDLFDTLKIQKTPIQDLDEVHDDENTIKDFTLFPHSSVSKSKWDIAPYWDLVT